MRNRITEDYVADIKTDAEFDWLSIVPGGLFAEFRLDLDGKAKRRIHVGEERDDAVPGDIDDFGAIITGKRPEQLDRPSNLLDGTRFVQFHPSAVLDHVGEQNGCTSRAMLKRFSCSRWSSRCRANHITRFSDNGGAH
jgi:hypothetical protein